MAVNKQESMARPVVSNFWVLPFAATILVLVVVLTNRPNNNQSLFRNTPPTPTGYEYPIDTENDGVYTDFKYGVRFKYPKDIFIYQDGTNVKDDATYVYWDKLEDGSSYAGGNEEGAHVRFQVNNIGMAKESIRHRFQDIYSHDIGVVNPKDDVVEFETRKLRNLEIERGLGMIYERLEEHAVYDEMGKYYSSGPEYFFAAWRKGDDTFWLTVSTNNKEEKDQYKKIFDDMVASIELFEPNQ